MSQKFDFYKHQPYVSLKVMACYWGKPLVESKRALRALFDWYDGLVNKAECPPCLVIFCEPGIIRAQGEAYLLCHMPLHAFQEAFVEWVAAALNPTTERRLEGIHAMIGVQGFFSLEGMSRRLPQSARTCGKTWCCSSSTMTTTSSSSASIG